MVNSLSDYQNRNRRNSGRAPFAPPAAPFASPQARFPSRPMLSGSSASRPASRNSQSGRGGATWGKSLQDFAAMVEGWKNKPAGGTGRLNVPRETEPKGFEYGGAPDLQSFMAAAGDGSALFSGQLAGIANRQADLQNRQGQARSAISGSTEALAAALAASRGELNSTYSENIKAAEDANAVLRQDVVEGAQGTRASEADLYKNLGMSDGLDQTRSVENQGDAVAALANAQQIASTGERSRQNTAFELGTRNIDAGRVRGMELSAASDRDYGTALAELLDEQQNVRANAQQSAQQAAMQQYQAALSQFNNDRDFAYGQYTREDDNARQDAQNALEMEMQANQPGELSTEDELIQQLMGYGVSAGKAGQWMNRAFNNVDSATGGLSRQRFGSLFTQATPAAKAALFRYLNDSGLIR